MRTWLYQTLKNDPGLIELFGNRFYQGESMMSANIAKPFLVYTIGNATDALLSEEMNTPERQFFQIYIHDEGADYTKIDEGVRRVKNLLRHQQSAEAGIIDIVYLETSRDLDDVTMNTILRYIRFQAIKEK